MTRDQKVAAIAEAFSEVLRQRLSKDEFSEMKQLNETDPDGGSSICASHEFCDANIAMDTAFTQVTGREADACSEEDAAICSDAWELARILYIGHQ